LTTAHWLYVIGVVVVIGTMLMRRNVVTPCIIFTFLIGWVYHGSMVKAVQTVFEASMAAAVELFSIFLIIGLMVGMLKAMSRTGADEMMISPLKGLLVSPLVSYVVLALATLVVALFFWPTPSVPLVGALLAPVAIKAGLPPLAAAMAIALAGQGMALAGDVIIQGAPKLTALAAGVPVEALLYKAGILTVIAGVIALTLGYWQMRPEIILFQKRIKEQGGEILDVIGAGQAMGTQAEDRVDAPGVAKFLAILVPVVMGLVIIAMIRFQILGGDATALLGGAAAVITVIATWLTSGVKSLDEIADCIGDGLVFAFRVMGPILPIAGFFFLGSPEAVVGILGEGAPGFLFDVGNIVAQSIPPTGFLAGFGILILGMITGLDGSGFSGLPLVGSLAGALSGGSVAEASTLGAIGQLGAVWTGGGTLVAWCTLVAVAGVVGVPVLDLVRKNLVPVLAGLFIATLFGIIFL
jgi:TRAP-type C4-dicarboxylate transport system permease large subunit